MDVSDTPTDTTHTEHRAPRAISFFNAADAPELMRSGVMSMPVIDPAVMPHAIELAKAKGDSAKVLFHRDPVASMDTANDDGDGDGAGATGISLVWVSFAPGYILPRHSHSADCLYYVVSGEAHMGNKVVRAGDGFFVPKDAPYAYTAGPEGVVILEFRTAGSFDMQVTESPERWERIVDNARQHAPQWRQ